VGALVLAGIALNEVRKYFRDKGKNTGTGVDISDIPTLDGSKVTDRSTITEPAATQIAIVSYDAMNRLGSASVDVIISSLNNLSGASLQRVYQMFGKPKYLATGHDSNWLGVDKDIFGWYRSEYSGSSLSKLKKVWAKSGLSFK
jgi:hypothetical protein